LLSGERERGTLAMLLSQPVSQRALVFGKAGARVLALCGVTLVFALLGLWVAGADLGQSSAWLHVGLFSAVLVAWALFWFAAAIAVNAWNGTSARNALVLVGLWLVLVVVVPGLVHVAVDTIHPPPSRMELLHQAREAARDAEKELTGLQGRHDVNTKTRSFAQKVVAVQSELAKRSAPVLKEMRKQMRTRQVLVDRLRFVSPAIVVQLALEDVAGAGAMRHQRFEEQVDVFHGSYQDYFFARTRAGNHLTSAELSKIPEMRYQEESSRTLTWRILLGLLALLLMAGAMIGVAWPRLARIGRLTR
jgi:ABC-2 type transport system permease protein